MAQQVNIEGEQPDSSGASSFRAGSEHSGHWVVWGRNGFKNGAWPQTETHWLRGLHAYKVGHLTSLLVEKWWPLSDPAPGKHGR